tara:strand:+ start:4301 stop:5356 length:1056 start_codon:yes stop_codon:yes gene_type:complete
MSLLIVFLILIISIISDLRTNYQFSTLTLLLSSVSSLIITKFSIKKLNKLKFNQIIKIEGPKHHLNKIGTPTMGGIIIVPAGIIIANLINLKFNYGNQILAISYITIAHMLIGSIDDWTSLVNKRNAGIEPKVKLFFQIIVSMTFLWWSYLENWIDYNIFLLWDTSINVGILIWPLALFVLIAESNATNLTDGLDGLASGSAALVFTGIGLQLISRENISDPSLIIFCMSMAGTWLGFLAYNKKPAKIFMGDTGSLSIGAALASIALLSNSLWALLIMGGVFFAESISVIIQVGFFKLTKKINGEGIRIFKMAPLHHHYELIGYKEKQIVNYFWLISIFLISIGYVLRTIN